MHSRAIARVHSVYAMNTETAPVGSRPLDQANRLEPQARLCLRIISIVRRSVVFKLLLTLRSLLEICYYYLLIDY